MGQEEIESKVCINCLNDREIRYFDRRQDNPDGFVAVCVECDFLRRLVRRAHDNTIKRRRNGRDMPPVEVNVDFLRARTTCCYSGLPLRFHPGVNDMASLDRKNNKDGYTFSNSQMCNIRFNIGISDEKQWNHDKYAKAFKPGWKDFIETCKKDLSNKPKDPHQPPHLGPGATEKENSDACTHSLTLRLNKIATSCNTRNATRCAQFKEKGKEVPNNIVTILPKNIHDMWNSQDGICAYSGIPMDWSTNTAWGVSIEKINGGFYTIDNMALVCYEFNSSEYHSTRFQDLCTGPQGWNREIVEFYRDLESRRQVLSDALSRWIGIIYSSTKKRGMH